jgi:hypothetical protein
MMIQSVKRLVALSRWQPMTITINILTSTACPLKPRIQMVGLEAESKVFLKGKGGRIAKVVHKMRVVLQVILSEHSPS